MNAEARPARWSGLIIWLHWIGAAIIIAIIAIGWAMIYGGFDAATTFDLYQWHKSFGFVALVLTAARLAARFATSSPPAPASAGWERRLAAFAQASIYVLTICAIISGWLAVSTSPLPVPTRFFDLFVIPNIAQPDPSLFADGSACAQARRMGNPVLVPLHVAGALKHHLFDRDDVLRRMSPNWPKLGASRR